jgi:hypothetical protein
MDVTCRGQPLRATARRVPPRRTAALRGGLTDPGSKRAPACRRCFTAHQFRNGAPGYRGARQLPLMLCKVASKGVLRAHTSNARAGSCARCCARLLAARPQGLACPVRFGIARFPAELIQHRRQRSAGATRQLHASSPGGVRNTQRAGGHGAVRVCGAEQPCVAGAHAGERCDGAGRVHELSADATHLAGRTARRSTGWSSAHEWSGGALRLARALPTVHSAPKSLHPQRERPWHLHAARHGQGSNLRAPKTAGLRARRDLAPEHRTDADPCCSARPSNHSWSASSSRVPSPKATAAVSICSAVPSTRLRRSRRFAPGRRDQRQTRDDANVSAARGTSGLRDAHGASCGAGGAAIERGV